MDLRLHPWRLAVVRLPAGSQTPDWARSQGGALRALVTTPGETSWVLPESEVPDDQASVQRGFRALEVEGPLDFALVGVLARLLEPLRGSGVSVFVLSTYDTDWILVSDEQLDTAVSALRETGHVVEETACDSG